jgi:ankyrin repeat protein
LHHAAIRGHAHIVKLFLNDPRINPMAFNDNGHNCLHFAAMGGNDDIVKLFLNEPRMEPMAINNYGYTYLDYLDIYNH